jgi:hypothetical protein
LELFKKAYGGEVMAKKNAFYAEYGGVTAVINESA